jgi:hypothetical protein
MMSVNGTGYAAREKDPDQGIPTDEIRLYWEEDVTALHLPKGTERKAFGVAIPCGNPKPVAGGLSLFGLLQVRKERLIALIRAEPGISDHRVQLAVRQVIQEYAHEQQRAAYGDA